MKQRRDNDEEWHIKLDNEFVIKAQLFKEYFFREFNSIKTKDMYYNNLVRNGINNIDTFILIENMDDINQYIRPTDKIQKILFNSKINQIKNDRNYFVQKLQRINMYHCLNSFDLNGIFTLNEYNIKIKSIDDLKKIINDDIASSLIFKFFNPKNINLNQNNIILNGLE